MAAAEKREFERIKLTITLPVINSGTETIIGELEDITSKGMKLLCNDELQTETVYQLVMKLPSGFGGIESISFIAKCVWCNINDTISLYHAGFQFENLEGDENEIIAKLIQRYGEDG